MDKFSQVGADRRFKSVEKSKKFNAAKEDRFNKYSKVSYRNEYIFILSRAVKLMSCTANSF